MELQQLEPKLESENKQPLNIRFLQVLSNSNPCLAEEEELLLSYYRQVKSTWSSSAIKSLQKSTGLKLTNKLNRCRFAVAAAKLQLQLLSSGGEEEVTSATWKSNSLPSGGVYIDRVSFASQVETDELFSESNTGIDEQFPKSLMGINNLGISSFQVETLDVEEDLQIAREQIKLLEIQLKEREEQLLHQEEQLKQSEQFSVLLLTNRLLTPGLPLNGTQLSPAMRVLGSPKTLTELEANYRELIKREHPDVSPFPIDVAIERFAYVRSLYRITRNNWEVFKPTTVISKEQLEARMNAPVPFEPKSFWVD